MILNRSQLNLAADLFGQLEPSGNQYRKYRNVSDVLVIWVLFSKDPHQQNRVLNRESNMNVIFENDYHLLREAKAGRLKSDGSNSGKVSDVEEKIKQIRNEIGNASWPFKSRTKKSLVAEWFIILGDPHNDFVEEHCPLLHALDTIFWKDMDNDEKFAILKEYNIVKSEKEANIMSNLATASPFLVSMVDLQRALASVKQENESVKQENASVKQENASVKQENASVKQENVSIKEELATTKAELATTKDELEAAYKKIASLEQTNEESKKS